MTESTSERFDGAAAWAGLDQAARDRIGPIALELVAAWHVIVGVGSFMSPQFRAAEFAVAHVDGLLTAAVHQALPDQFDDEKRLLPSLLGPVCKVCGCSEHDACPGGCAWAEPNLCTACAEPAAKAEAGS